MLEETSNNAESIFSGLLLKLKMMSSSELLKLVQSPNKHEWEKFHDLANERFLSCQEVSPVFNTVMTAHQPTHLQQNEVP
jgi:hypothetical protein